MVTSSVVIICDRKGMFKSKGKNVHLSFLPRLRFPSDDTIWFEIYFLERIWQQFSFFYGKSPTQPGQALLMSSTVSVRWVATRSEERRVGKVCSEQSRSRWSPDN